jgi:hypothetical protein
MTMARIYLAKGFGNLTQVQRVELKGFVARMKGGVGVLHADDIGLYVQVPEEIGSALRMLPFLKFL